MGRFSFVGDRLKVKKKRKVKIMIVLGMVFAVVVALAAEIGAINNKLA